ncbi:hypothetical protein [Burkholderia phage BgManors32]|uniref:Anti-CBASS protein Acb1-like N-terminal domain-containing protein n=1 Tax=Burkholderia phage BgManors32 TaxID=2894335 RepID=A0AAE9C6U5_9CAUD|nr:hypothetical protein PQC05_gp77 [Burkholderia phage BgManors32]UEW68641.1 hypothetical protein [Burkholderia phage BgManors32]
MSRKKPQTRPSTPTPGTAAVGMRTSDSFANFQARLGWGADNQSSASQYTLTYQSRNRIWLEAAYRGSWIVRAAVDAIPEDMTRKGIEMSGLDPTDITKIETAMTRLAIWDHLCDTGKWAQLYGGAIAVMLIDGQDMSTPLRVETIGKGQFKGLLVLDRWMVAPPVGETVTEFGPYMGMPMFYDVLPSAMKLPQGRIHYSRVIRLDGEALPYYQRISENGWGLSILEPMWDRLIAFDSATVGIGQLVYKAHLRTLSVKDLRQIIAQGGPAYAGLLKQVEMIRFAQTNEGLTLVDSEDTFTAHQFSFSGLPDVLLQFAMQLSGATGIPLDRLFGQQPAGLSDTGEGSRQLYHEKVHARQERKFRNPLHVLIDVVCRSTVGQQLPEDFGYEFRPLQEMTAAEKAEIGNKTVDSVTKAVDADLITRSQGMRELKASSPDTGMFGDISDEAIEQAEADEQLPEPPAIETSLPGSAVPTGAAPSRTRDSLVQRLFRLRRR